MSLDDPPPPRLITHLAGVRAAQGLLFYWDYLAAAVV